MEFYILLLISFYMTLFIFLGAYLIIKTKYALQAYQQSAYNTNRYIGYIKKNYKYTFGLNELLLVLIFILFIKIKISTPYLFLLKYFLVLFFSFYNLKFFNISKRRYTEKVKFKLTNRVKRLIATLIIINSILFILLSTLLNFGLFLNLIIITYIIYLTIILSGIINTPIEKYIHKSFKQKATSKLNKFSNLTVIGITGSFGKTSIKNIIYDILNKNEITLKTPASFNTPMGVSITINNDLNKMYKNFIVEMGAYYPGEIKELCDMVSPKIGIVSSIGKQHLETFKTIENVQKTKMELIESLPADGLGILNYDNEYIRNYKIKNKVNIKWYSLENPDVDLYAFDIKYLENGMNFSFNFKNKTYNVTTRLLGIYNIYNILAAILVCDYKNIDIEKILKVIPTIKSIENRLELKQINENLTIIDDSFNGNVKGLIEGIKILQNYPNTKILITPGIIDGGEENSALNEEISKNITNIDYAFIIGKYNKESLCKHINKNVKVKTFDNFLDGYNYAIKIANKKTILIANDLPDKYN